MDIKGQVKDSISGEFLFGANIFISDKFGNLSNPPKASVADPDGYYSLNNVTPNIGKQNYISASYVGYETKTVKIVGTSEMEIVDFSLSPKTEQIPEFQVVAEKPKPANARMKTNNKTLIYSGIVLSALLIGLGTYLIIKK